MIAEFQENDKRIHRFALGGGEFFYEVETRPGHWDGASTLEEALELANNSGVIWR